MVCKRMVSVLAGLGLAGLLAAGHQHPGGTFCENANEGRP